MNVVVVGGGIAGVRAALECAKARVGRVTLVSESAHLRHHETLQLARMGLTKNSSRISLDELCAEYANIRVILDTAISIDVDRKHLIGKAASYEYDELIMSLGVVSKHGGADTVNTLTHIYSELEADYTAGRHFDRVITIVGGGKEGVELAGAVHEYTKNLIQEYPTSPSRVEIRLVEQQPVIVPRHSTQAQRKVLHRLRHNGIKVQVDVSAHIAGSSVICGNDKVPLHTTLWANGSVNNPFYVEHPEFFQIDRNGCVDVDPYLEAYPHIYVIGQNLSVQGTSTVKNTLDTADFIVDHLLRISTREYPLPYRATSTITTIETDSRWAYVECFGVYVTGWFGRKLAAYIERVNIRKIMSSVAAKIFVVRSTTKM